VVVPFYIAGASAVTCGRPLHLCNSCLVFRCIHHDSGPLKCAPLLPGWLPGCSPSISGIDKSKQEPCTVPRATARAGLLSDCSSSISGIDKSEDEPLNSAPRYGKCWASVWLRHFLLHPHQRPRQQREVPLHCAPRHGTCWAAVGLQPLHQRHRQQRPEALVQCPAPWHVLGCCRTAALPSAPLTAPSWSLCTVPRATAHAELMSDCINSNELEPLYSGPYHGTCWAAVGLHSTALHCTALRAQHSTA